MINGCIEYEMFLLQVLPQFGALREFRAALIALKLVFSHVNFHMRCQITLHPERMITDFADIRFLVQVNQEMLSHVSVLSESFSAVFAGKLFLAGVNVWVHFEARHLGERLTACRAFKGSLAWKKDKVFYKVPGVRDIPQEALKNYFSPLEVRKNLSKSCVWSKNLTFWQENCTLKDFSQSVCLTDFSVFGTVKNVFFQLKASVKDSFLIRKKNLFLL